jgi:hypothetical protein
MCAATRLVVFAASGFCHAAGGGPVFLACTALLDSQAEEEEEEQRRSDFLIGGEAPFPRVGGASDNSPGPVDVEDSFSSLLSNAMKKNEAHVQTTLQEANTKADGDAAAVRAAREAREAEEASAKLDAAALEARAAAAAEEAARKQADQRKKEQDVRVDVDSC